MKKKSFAFGYSMIIAMALSWICLNFYNTVSLNVYIPAIAEKLTVSTAPLLYMTTVGWVASCFVTIIGGRIIPKMGAKSVLCVSAIAEGVVFAGIGLSRNLLLTQSLIAVSSCLSVLYCQLTSVAIIANWFPRKKGVILGLVTSAIAIVPIVCLPLFSFTITEQGITAAMCEWAGFIILYGIVGLFWIREYPAQAGLSPDNMPLTDKEQAEFAASANAKGSWKILDVLLSPKIMLATIGWGLQSMGLMGVMTVAVSILTSSGLAESVAVALVSIGGIANFVGSNISGVIDSKCGLMKSAMIFVGMQAIGCLMMGLNISGILVGLGYCMALVVSGSANNLYASHVLTLSGPNEYVAVYSVSMALSVVIRAFGSSISAFSFDTFGTYNVACIFFAVVCASAMVMIRIAGNARLKSPAEKKLGPNHTQK